MHTYQGEVEAHPTPEDVQFLDDRLYEYNAAQTGVDEGQWLAIFVRDDQQRLCAGIKGWTWCGSCISAPSGSMSACGDREWGPNSSRQQSRKPAPVVAIKSSSTPIVFRHQASIRNMGMKCLRSLKTIPAIIGTIICGNA
jgi:hypothetical protein